MSASVIPTVDEFKQVKTDLSVINQVVNSAEAKDIDLGGGKKLPTLKKAIVQATTYAPFRGRGAFSPGEIYEVNDVWEHGGSHYFVPSEYTSGENASADIAAGLVVLHQQRNNALSVTSVEQLSLTRPLFEGQSAILNDGGRSGTFNSTSADISDKVAIDPLKGFYIAFSDTDGSDGGWVRDSDHTTLEMFGAAGSQASDARDSLFAAIRLGMKVVGRKGAKYNIGSNVSVVDIAIDIDLNGAILVNTSETDRMLIADYPYLSVQKITNIDLYGGQVTIENAAEYSVGDRVKVVSQDRCPGNRPAPGDGRNYWQAQTLTVNEIDGNVLSFREDFEGDFTFSTNPKVMIYNKKSCRIYNGTVYSEKGFESSRSNGLLRVRGGSNHRVGFDVENSNATAIQFFGCDNPRARDSTVSNVGRSSDTFGSHGYGFISCNSPSVSDCDFYRTRHGQTNNDTPTHYSDENYYEMGPTYNMQVTKCTNTADLAGGFSTHHGIRGAAFSEISAINCAIGIGIRGWDVTVRGFKSKRCGKPVFVYSEADVSSVDMTTRWYVGGVESVKTTGPWDLQVQKCQFGTLESNSFKGSVANGCFLNNGGTVVLHGHNEFFSSAEFEADGNFLAVVNTNVENFGMLSIDIDRMTVNGNNNVIRSTSEKFFKSYGKIIIEEPAGMDNVFRHIGDGQTLIEDLRYVNNIGFPVKTSNSDETAVRGRTLDGSYSTSYQIKTATSNHVLGINNAIDREVTVVLLTDSGEHTLGSIKPGKFVGQKLLLRVSGSHGFVLSSSVTGLDLNGGDITIPPDESRRFVWGSSSWRIESRNP